MLPTFRILLATTGLTALAVVVAAHGLIPAPEVRTRIGEVPTISRSFIQQAMAPRLPIQALGDPAEEHAPAIEVTGMASGQEIVRLPLGTVDGGASDETIPRSTNTADETDSSDPLGDLIKSTLVQTPESRPADAADPTASQLTEAADLQPLAVEPAAAPEAMRLASPTAEDIAAPPVPARSEDTARVDGEEAAPVKGQDSAKTVTSDAASPARDDSVKAGTNDTASPARDAPAEPPALARGDEPASREKVVPKSRSRTPALESAALNGKGLQATDSATDAGKRRTASSRKTIEPRKSRAAVEKRAVRRKAVTKSRTTSARKIRKAAPRVKRHKNRRAADPAPRRGVVVVAPRRSRPATSAPTVQYLSPVYPYQVAPGGYYLPPSGGTLVR